nr:pentatricopeptide repeat-containing protein At1g71460, chloroplastic [Ipomoea batatas]
MECMANYNLTSLSPKPPPPTLHNLRSLLPSSLRPHQNHHHAFNTKASSTIDLSPQKRSNKKRTKPTAPRKFREQDAFPDSIPIHSKNPHSVYKDIQSFARQNRLKEVLSILDYLDQRGIPVNVTTFASIIEACVRKRALNEARTVHTHIRINGLENNEFLQTKLVNMYAACGAVEDAKKLFDGMPVRSVYPWNALLRGNVVLGGRKYHEVLDTFSEMRAQGVELNVYSFSCMIKSLAGASAFSQGLKTHGLLVKNGFLGSNIIRTSLIDMYFKCGKINLACRVFEEIENRDVVAWGAMIAGFAHNRLQREALECTRQMIEEGLEVNSVILTTILPVIGEMWAWRIGQEAHAYVLKTKDYSKQLFIQSALIDMYCKCGDLASGRKVFYSSKERNAVSWTALLAGYVENGRLDQALRSITWMQQEGFKPDIVTLATVLPVCGKLKALVQGKEIHGYAVKNGFLPNVSVATSLMMMYAKCGLLEYSVRVFEGMEKRNVIAWTAMISSYIESGSLHEALDVFRAMQLSKHRPDSVAMARMLEICGELRDLKLGREVHAQVLKKDLACVPFVSAETIRMYGSCGAIDEARFSFDAVSVKGPITWTAIIEAYGLTGQYVEALQTFKQMISKGSSPNAFTFKAILHICEQAGFADEACKFFSLMTKRYKIEASKEHYDSIISLLNSVGQFEKADRFVHLRSLLE